MTRLLDGNILVALSMTDHPLYGRSAGWFGKLLEGKEPFATCWVTEGTLLRMHMRLSGDSSAKRAWIALESFYEIPGHEFWDDNFSYREVAHAHLQGYKQVTDAWLVELARRRGGKLATLDAALAVLHPEAVELVPVVL